MRILWVAIFRGKFPFSSYNVSILIFQKIIDKIIRLSAKRYILNS